jgi:hypothetical protein
LWQITLSTAILLLLFKQQLLLVYSRWRGGHYRDPVLQRLALNT